MKNCPYIPERCWQVLTYALPEKSFAVVFDTVMRYALADEHTKMEARMFCKHSAGVSRLFLIPLCLGLLAGGCASRELDTTPEGMTLSVDLREVHRCSRISPEIHLENIPQGTQSYQVRLLEYHTEGEKLLGGGSWDEDGSGIIPEGALTQFYRGPCPKQGQSGRYGFVVSAYGQDTVQPLVVRVYQFSQE